MSKRNFCALQVLIAVMVIVLLLANTYAWSDRDSWDGNVNQIELNYISSVNGRNSAKAKTYPVIDGVVDYGSEIITQGDATYSVSVSANEVLRFVTVVTNESTDSIPAVTSNVSLLLKNVSLSDFTVRVSSPTHEYADYEITNVNNWIRVVPSCEIPAGETVEFEWSIEFKDQFQFEIGDIVLAGF